ncbi:MAG TPA: chemotaxis protein CheA [Methanomassiliicoccales archaeon]|jgi:two-component system chemotaxis sensor kinase CheA
MVDKSKYLDVFIEEARENLQGVNNVLLELEEKGFSEESMKVAYRVVHTIKGTAAVIGIDSISELAHVMEDLFGILVEQKKTPEKKLLNLLFRGVDTIEKMIVQLEKDGVTDIKVEGLIAEMKQFENLAAKSNEAAVEAREEEGGDLPLSTEQKKQVNEAISAGKLVFEVVVTYEKNLKFKEGRAFQLVRRLSQMGTLITSKPLANEVKEDDDGITLVLATQENAEAISKAAKDIIGMEQVDTEMLEGFKEEESITGAAAQDTCEASRSEAGPSSEKSLNTGNTIRVKSKLLDQLLDLVGEIMINNIRINQIATDLKHRELKQTLQNNSRLMTEMQDIVLRTRMVPVDFIFKRFPRMVRDVSEESKKDVEFTMKGNDIEIDRSLLDEIGDALVHLLRNAVDHGIEPADQRKNNGKPAKGTLVLSAFREQSSIVITVEDDGRGMDPAKIAKKAVQKGLVSQEEVERMEEKKILSFVFLPGFSTAEKISDISGRGVGLDVVKTKIEGLGGFVKMDTAVGKGTKFTLKLPPSMSIIRAMLVEVNNEKYAIPLENVRETVRVNMDQVIEVAHQGVFRLRDEVLPVLNIHSEFGGLVTEHKDMPAIIVEKNENSACLLVTRLIGQQEIVVKNLGRDLRSAGFFSGATILGDGKVAMILDVGAFI